MTYTSYAILYELNSREFRRKLALFPEEIRYYVILASGIIGAENARRVKEIPGKVVEDGNEFVSRLLDVGNPGEDETFRTVLESYLIETIKDELSHSCANCSSFSECLDMENLSVGELFRRRANGEETEELKREIEMQIEKALKGTPYIDTDSAHTLCPDFRHQYSVSDIGEVFGRYSDIAASLKESFGIDYRKIQAEMISINMEFFSKSNERI